MNFKKRELITFLIAVFFIGLLGSYVGIKIFQPNVDTSSNINIPVKKSADGDVNEQMDVIKQVYELIDQEYVDDVDNKQLLEGAIQGMLDTLEDPYSSYMDADAMERFNEQITSSFQGIGAEVSLVDGKVTIIAPIKDSPAEKAGLRPNDQILKVDDQKLEGMDLNEAVEHIRGEKGSEVVLLVERKGAADPFEVKLTRDDIPIETVHADTENIDGKKTGILEISSFSETTADEFTEALDKLENENIKGLIIDVRGNPGGLLDSVENIMNHFIPKDLPYVQVEERNGDTEKFYSTLEKKKPYPINIIVDEGSASASEILAVALKETGYDVVGETSFGKGTVQKAVPIENGGTVKLTFFKWLSPKGNWIHEKGVEPTVEQKQPAYYYSNPIQIKKPLTYDHTGDQIKNAQVMLKGLGYDPDRKDGYFDKATKEAVMKFQKDHNLQADGIIDEETAGSIEADIIEKIRNGKDDMQLQKAMDVLYK